MTEIDFGEIKSTAVFGYSPLAGQDLAAKIAAGTQLSDLPGDFVLTVTGINAGGQKYSAVIVSAVCVLPYYYYHDDRQFVHGQNVFAVFQTAQIDWHWNEFALRSNIALTFCLDDDSLHRDIKRVAPATIYYYCQSKLTTVADTFPTDIFDPQVEYSDRDTLDIYNRVFDEYYGDRQICLSLSGGYDSRVFLASFLQRGIKPPVATEGSPDSLDVITAKAIAKDFGLEHRTIQLSEADFIANAPAIIEATSGEIAMSAAWGPYLFLKRIQFPSQALHLAGTNGGLFKANYASQAIFYQAADLLPNLILKQFFNAYLLYKKRPYQGFPLKAFNCFKQPVSTSISDRCYQLAKVVPNFSNQVDYFHTFNRVRNYTGKGLALYNPFNLTSSPFLDRRMVRAGARLATKYKLNSYFHQQILLDSCPQLAEYPMNGKNISPSGSTEYDWIVQQSQSQKGKSTLSKLIKNPELLDLYHNSPHLDYFMERRDRIKALDQGVFAVFSFLVSMHYVSEKIAEHRRSD